MKTVSKKCKVYFKIIFDIEQVTFEDDSCQGFFNHRESVYSVSLHPVDSNIAVSAGGDDKARVWRIDTGEELAELASHSDSAIQASFNFDGSFVASGGLDGVIKVFKTENFENVVNLEGPSEVSVIKLKIIKKWFQWHKKGNVILCGSTDGTCWMWNVPSGQCMNVFSGHTASVLCGTILPDGRTFITADEMGTLIQWDPKTGEILMKLQASSDFQFHEEGILSLDVSRDGSLVATTGSDQTCKLVSLQAKKVVGTLMGHEDAVEAVKFSNFLPFIATGGMDGNLIVWDVQSCQPRQKMVHDGGIVKLEWIEDSPLIVSVSVDCNVRVWDSRTGECLKIFKGHENTILDFAKSKDGKTIVTASDDGNCLVFKWE
ncbi:WD40 repeat-like protein [Rozella allomycis CSF55]|uniref:WD40 repeat-like protein n=1 Tax=Rozella allomycis (strain CSF55) TaxID=988480 RepID=A0A4P9YCT7_ROZAC|nr:WD40 repeat-like protein [Rozella allomycis CSF55]